MPRLASRKDSNHNQIKQALERVGAVVLETYQLPGLLDMLVGFRKRWVLLEVKDGDKPVSARKLTEEEEKTFQRIGDRAPAYVVESVDDALRVITR